MGVAVGIASGIVYILGGNVERGNIEWRSTGGTVRVVTSHRYSIISGVDPNSSSGFALTSILLCEFVCEYIHTG